MPLPTPLPGETLGTAIALTPTSQPQTLDLVSNINSNNIFYTFNLTSRSSFLIAPPSNNYPNYFTSPDLAILDSTGNPVNVNGKPQVSTNSGVLPNLISTVLDPGTYYIRLFAADIPNTGFSPSIFYNLTYQATLGTAGNLPLPYDIAGNTPNQALNLGYLNSYSIADPNSGVIPSRGSFTNVLNSSNPEDYYLFDVSTAFASSSPLNLTITGLQSNADLQLIPDANGNGLIDPDEIINAITSNRTGTQDEAIYRIVTGSFNRYFIRVNRVEGDTPYTLNISTGGAGELLAGEFEVGNLGATTRSYAGNLSNDNAADLYRFTLLNAATVNLQLTGQNGNANLKLYEKLFNGTGNFLQSVNSSTTIGQLSRTLEPGIYYVRLTGTIGTSYSLNLGANTLLPTERVSVSSSEAQAYGESLGGGTSGSFYPALNADGRYVVFTSFASNLVAGDTNNNPDVFVRDRLTGETTRVSVASNGTQGNRGATIGGNTPISADGRYVVFTSGSNNLVADDTNTDPPQPLYNWQDAFVHDRLTGRTIRVNVASNGTQANNGGGTIAPAISANGRYVTFSSVASNLIANDTNGIPGNEYSGFDIFVHDLQTGITTRESVATDGTQGNNYSLESQISGDGRYLVFWSAASNLVAGDTNNRPDVFLRDRVTGQTTRVSVAADGTQIGGQSASISTDGRYISYTSSGNILLYDRISEQTTQVSIGIGGAASNGNSYTSSLSADGRYVVYNSNASNLVAGDTNAKTDVFLYDRTIAQTTRVSLAYDNAQGNDNSAGRYTLFNSNPPDAPVVSADGRYIAFTSAASNLIEGDTNYAYDIFVRNLSS